MRTFRCIVYTFGIIAIAAAGCAKSSPGTGGTGDGGGGDGGGDGGTVANTPGDTLPTGAVSFFATMTCPDGWDPYAQGDGRFVVPSVGIDHVGAVAGEPLRSGEDRAHMHTIAMQTNLGKVSYVGAPGGGNHGVAAAGTVSLMATSDTATTGLPYVQLRVCKKSSAPKQAAAPLPRGLLMFFDGQSCPDGWTQATASQGRFVVGLPDRGLAGATFGGTALGSQEARAHTHAAHATLSTAPHGIALASGCCGDGYAQNGTYTFSAMSSPADAALPYIQLLQCQKN